MIKESSIVEAVSAYLDHKSFRVVTELPFLQRHIDVVGLDPASDLLIAVEAKIKNWQVALRQAITCLLFADEVYIAMPTAFIHRVNQTELGRYGIGLLGVGKSVRIVVNASSSRFASQYHRSTMVERLYLLETEHSGGKIDAEL